MLKSINNRIPSFKENFLIKINLIRLMIHKIERLISVGKFRSYQATGDVAFKKLTLIYADNGSGKTTLTAVLRSLTQNNPEVINKRLSTNSTTTQAGQIIQRDSVTNVDTFHSFGATGWSNTFPDIEIFDIHFVNDNIYSGFEFNDDHRKQLHQFVIGAQGIGIQNQIEANKANKTTSRIIQTGYENQLITQVGNGLTIALIQTFLSIPISQTVNIGQLILAAEAVLANARANTVIQTLQKLNILPIINSMITFPNMLIDLETTIQTIQDASLQEIFNAHCAQLAENGIEGAEQWLKTGFGYIERKNEIPPNNDQTDLTCPFCAQSITEDINIINAYTNRFNEEFNALLQRLQTYMQSLDNFNLDSIIQRLNYINQNNTVSVNSWATHLPNSVQVPIFNIITDEAILITEFNSLIAIVRQKIQNPSIAVNTDSLNTFSLSLENINSSIATYNQSVVTYNNSITAFRSSIQPEPQALIEVNKLKRIQKRHEPAIDAICNLLIAEKQNLRNLELAYPALVQQQEDAATLFFTDYKDRINHYLTTVFRTPFRIEDVINIPPQGRATQSKIGYKLTIDGQDISFDSNLPNNAKDCLSEGDRSTLALAFFLSKLDIDQRKDEKVLVFDDPLSSFDSNRRFYTVQLIKKLMAEMKQIIVMSHNEWFLYDLSKGISRGDRKELRITENFVTRASIIEPLELEKLVENDYFKHLNELAEFIQHADISRRDTILGLMRNVLEAHIRFKFYRQTSHLQPNNRTFGNLITALVEQNVTFRDNADRVNILAKLTLINQISSKPHHGEPLPDYNLIGIDPATITVPELVGFVQDTLNLIDNQL